MNMNINSNPIISDPSCIEQISFAQTRDSLMDTEIYSRFIYSIENQFRRSRFYKAYKCHIMNLGLDFDQEMRNISGEMCDIELHHLLPTLNQAAIMITEHQLNNFGQVTTFEVIKLLEEAHRNNWMSIVMLSTTMHQAFHSDPSAFISLSQAYGNCFGFLEHYRDGLTLDIAFKWLLQLKLEDQHNSTTTWMNIPKQREELLNWSIDTGNFVA